MGATGYPGEFEHMVLLAILQCDDQAFALEIRDEVQRSAERRVSRGAFYTTLERLERKGLIRWSEEAPRESRAGPKLHRRYELTRDGLVTLGRAQRAFRRLARGLEDLWSPG